MPTYTVNAFDDPGSHAGLTVFGDHIEDIQQIYVTNGRVTELLPSFYVRGANLPPAGLYTVELELIDPDPGFSHTKVLEGHFETPFSLAASATHDDVLTTIADCPANTAFFLAAAFDGSIPGHPALLSAFTSADHSSISSGAGTGHAFGTSLYAEAKNTPQVEDTRPYFMNADLASGQTVNLHWVAGGFGMDVNARSVVAVSIHGLEHTNLPYSNIDGSQTAKGATGSSTTPSVTMPLSGRSYTSLGNGRPGVLIAVLAYDNAGDPGFIVDAGWTLMGEYSDAAAAYGVAIYAQEFGPDDNDYTFSGTLGSSASWQARIETFLKPHPFTYTIMSRNGRFLFPESFPAGAGWSTLTGRKVPAEDFPGPGPKFLPIVDGDEIAFHIYEPGVTNPAPQIAAVRLTSVDEGGVASDPIGGSAGTNVALLGTPTTLGGGDLLNTPVTDIRFNPGSYTDPEYIAAAFTYNGNGELFVAWMEFNGPTTVNLGMKKWDGASWTTITSDISGHGAFALPNRGQEGLSMATDGTDIWVAWVEESGDIFTRPFFTGYNVVWRVKKYTVATDTWTELGSSSGQRAHATHDLAYTGMLLPRLKIGPDGKAWIGWQEPDNTAEGSVGWCVRPFLWYYSGGAWHDSGLPDPTLPTGATEYQANTISYDGWGVEFDFYTTNDGGSNWPSAIYNAAYTGATIAATQDAEFVYQKYDGASWTNVQQFTAHDVWAEMHVPGDIPAYGTRPAGKHWPQGGIHLMQGPDGYLWFFTTIFGQGGNFGNADESRSCIARQQLDDTWARLPVEAHWDPTFFDAQTLFWSDPGGGWPAIDGFNDLWVRSTQNQNDFGDLIVKLKDIGTHDGWTNAVNVLAPLPDPAYYNPAPLLFDWDNAALVPMSYYDNDSGDTPLVVWRMERELVSPWAAAARFSVWV